MDASPAAGEQILVIEGNKTNRELMIYLLNTFGYSTCEAENGRLGVEMARAEEPQNGLDLLDRAKTDRELRSVPVVIISSTSTEMEDERKCLERRSASRPTAD